MGGVGRGGGVAGAGPSPRGGGRQDWGSSCFLPPVRRFTSPLCSVPASHYPPLPRFGGCPAGGLPLLKRAGGTSLTGVLELGPIIERRREKKKKNPGGQRPGRKALLLLAGSALGVRAWPPAPTPAPGGLTLLLLFPAYVSSPFPSWPTSCASVNPLHVPACMNTSLKKKQNPVLSFEPRCLKPLSPPPAPIPSSLQSPEKGHFPGRPHRKALRYVLLSRFCFDRVAGVLPASVSLHLQ